jgi:cysteine desulfuration protein SufE
MRDPARSMDDVQAEIIQEMSALEDALARYEYLIAQGDALPLADADVRTEKHAVPGCQVSVWIKVEAEGGRLRLYGDSDARIIRGLVALLLRVLDGRAAAEIVAADLFFLDRTGLKTHLSPTRANGLAALVQRIRGRAEEHAFDGG